MKKKLITLMTLLLCVCSGAWGADDILIDFPTSKTNISIGGTTVESSVTVKGASKSSYQLKNNYLKDGYNYIQLTTTGGFKSGDVVTIKACYSNSSTKETAVELYGGATTATASLLWTSGPCVNVKDGSTEPSEESYTLESDQTNLYFGRNGNTGTHVIYIEVTRAKETDTASPTITTDLSNDPYAANIGSPLALSIAAEHYTGFQWYTCDSDGSNAESISGATSSTYNYTPDATGTFYLKCIVTNTNATGAQTATSKVATINVSASNDASVSSVVVVANGTYTASASGTAYTATIGGTTSAKVTITPNHETATVTYGATTGSVGKSITVDATADTQLAFSITAGDGTTTVNYTLDITKANDKTATGNAYYLSNEEAIYGGQRVIGDDITMTFSDVASGTFTAAVSDNYIKDHDANYVASTAGNGQNGSASGIQGTWYKFSPTVDGVLTVGVVVNDGKNLYIYKNDKTTKITSLVNYWAYGSATFNEELKASGKIYGLVTINVESGQNYYFSVGGSKLGFYGFKFIPSVFGISTASGRNYASHVTTKKLDFASAEGITAYIATGFNGDKDAIVLKEVDIVPSGTPIIVNTTTQGATVNVPITTDDESSMEGNALVAGDGTTAWNGTDGYTYYYLASDLFHQATSGTLQSGKAYLKVANGDLPSARSFGFVFDDDATGINDVKSVQKNDNRYYNLNGLEVAQPTKGLYIVNGKKVVIK